jgi:hypothetical protein
MVTHITFQCHVFIHVLLKTELCVSRLIINLFENINFKLQTFFEKDVS